MELILKYPFDVSLMHMQDVCYGLNFRTISSGCKNALMIIAIPWDVYKRLFDRNPTRGLKPMPQKPKRMAAVITSMKVVGTEVIEL